MGGVGRPVSADLALEGARLDLDWAAHRVERLHVVVAQDVHEKPVGDRHEPRGVHGAAGTVRPTLQGAGLDLQGADRRPRRHHVRMHALPAAMEHGVRHGAAHGAEVVVRKAPPHEPISGEDRPGADGPKEGRLMGRQRRRRPRKASNHVSGEPRHVAAGWGQGPLPLAPRRGRQLGPQEGGRGRGDLVGHPRVRRQAEGAVEGPAQAPGGEDGGRQGAARVRPPRTRFRSRRVPRGQPAGHHASTGAAAGCGPHLLSPHHQRGDGG